MIAQQILKKCNVCGKEKPYSCFSKQKKSKNGLRNMCKSCKNLEAKKYRKKNKKEIAKWREKNRKENREKIWAQQTIWWHKQKGYVIDISEKEIEDMLQIALKSGCYYCGVQLKFGEGYAQYNSPTIDITNPNLNIMDKTNCKIICHSCNAGKRDLSEKDWINKCKRIVERMERK